MSEKTDYNSLQEEQSSFLSQYNKDKIHWHPYGPVALQRAKNEKKPIYLSIGHSSCFGCKVFANESLRTTEVTNFINENFISILVDKDEMPDLDQYYQLTCSILTGKSGWPLNAFLTEDEKPFFIGTYFPQNSSQEQAGFFDVLKNVKNSFDNEQEDIKKSAEEISKVMTKAPEVEQKVEFEGHFPAPASILNALKEFQDDDFGGYGPAPKFPQYSFYEWAIEHILEGMIPEEFGKHIIVSIENMIMGGLYDHVRGGVFRFSTDQTWTVPNFEKKLYDQASFLRLMAKATLLYPSPLLYDAMIQTMEYLKAEMTSEEGFFLSAQAPDTQNLEGLYFTFTKDEFIDACIRFDESLTDKMEDILKWFKITEKGNFKQGLNIIQLDIAHKEEFYGPENWNLVRQVRMALLEDRKTRIPPITDNKGISSWNFQMISALIDVIQYCKIESIAQSASGMLNNCLEGVHNTFVKQDPDTGKTRLISSTTNPGHSPLLEDVVMFAQSQLRFFEISGNKVFRQNGIDTIQFIFKEFQKDGYFYTRALEFSDIHSYENIHTPIFDQAYKCSLATLISLVRKWSLTKELDDELEICEKLQGTMAHLSLQNPIIFGETLRALTYPKEAYRRIRVPVKWLENPQFHDFFANFSTRFILDYLEEDKWEIWTDKEIEFSGSDFNEFKLIFSAPDDKNA